MDSIGLGVFDAFFASLSMIIVSEVGVVDYLSSLILYVNFFRKNGPFLNCTWVNLSIVQSS